MRDSFFYRNRAVMTVLLVVFGVGLAHLCYSAGSILCSRYYIVNMPEATATLTRLTSRRIGDSRITREYVSYTIDGVEYHDVYVAHQKYALDKGDTVPIHYNPARPKSMVAAHQSYYSRVFGIAGGLFLLGFAADQTAHVKKRDRRSMRLVGEGICISATATGISKYPRDEKSPQLYCIECEYYDSHTTQTHTFVSDPCRLGQPESVIGAEVPVLVDMNDFSVYRVETDVLTAKPHTV